MTPFNHVVRRTVGTLGGQFGRDKHRRLVVQLQPGDGDDRKDMLILHPEGTRRKVQVAAVDIYRIALAGAARLALLERARQAKERKAATRERRRLDARQRRFRQSLNNHP